jgi:hypothetical protein
MRWPLGSSVTSLSRLFAEHLDPSPLHLAIS